MTEHPYKEDASVDVVAQKIMSSEQIPDGIDPQGNLVAFKIVDHKPSDAEIAADIKGRIAAAMPPVLELFDEANRLGFLVRWDGVGPAPPLFKNQVLGLRLEKHY